MLAPLAPRRGDVGGPRPRADARLRAVADARSGAHERGHRRDRRAARRQNAQPDHVAGRLLGADHRITTDTNRSSSEPTDGGGSEKSCAFYGASASNPESETVEGD